MNCYLGCSSRNLKPSTNACRVSAATEVRGSVLKSPCRKLSPSTVCCSACPDGAVIQVPLFMAFAASSSQIFLWGIISSVQMWSSESACVLSRNLTRRQAAGGEGLFVCLRRTFHLISNSVCKAMSSNFIWVLQGNQFIMREECSLSPQGCGPPALSGIISALLGSVLNRVCDLKKS